MPAWNSSRCKSCLSENQTTFDGEMALKFRGGLEALEKPIVWVFPQVTVCLNCGAAEFVVPEQELRELAAGHKESTQIHERT